MLLRDLKRMEQSPTSMTLSLAKKKTMPLTPSVKSIHPTNSLKLCIVDSASNGQQIPKDRQSSSDNIFRSPSNKKLSKMSRLSNWGKKLKRAHKK